MKRNVHIECSRGRWYAVRYIVVGEKVRKRYERLDVEPGAARRTAERAFRAVVLRDEAARAAGLPAGQDSAVADYAEEFLAAARIDVRPATYRSYALWVRRFTFDYGHLALGEIEASHIERWKRALAGSLAPASVNCALRAVRTMFGRAVKQHTLAHSPFDGVRMADEERPDFPPYWSDGQFRGVLQRVTSQRLRVGFCLAFYAGLRARECVTLRWEDIGEGQIRVVSREGARTKSGRSRTVPIFARLREELERLPRRGEYVLASKYQAITDERALSQKFLWHRRRYAEHLPPINFHGLRHSFATGCAVRGMPLPVLQKIMGHAQITTTAMYMHVQEQHAATAAARFDPENFSDGA